MRGDGSQTIFNVLQGAFLAGEIDPSMYGNISRPQYQGGLARCFNFYVKPQGGVENRPGTVFSGKLDGFGIKIPFKYSASQSYHLEFTDFVMRIVSNHGMVLRPLNSSAYDWVTSAHGADERYCALHTTHNDPSILAPADGEIYYFGLKLTRGTIGSLAPNEWAYGDNDSLGFDTIYISFESLSFPTGESPSPPASTGDFEKCCVARISSPYAASELRRLKYYQTDDVIILTHSAHKPITLARNDHWDWTFSEINFEIPASGIVGLVSNYSDSSPSKPRNIKYKVSAIIDGIETLPVGPVTTKVDMSWATGANVRITWDDIPTAEKFIIYKSPRGYYGWIGTVVREARQSVDYRGNGSLTEFDITWQFDDLSGNGNQHGTDFIVEKISWNANPALRTVLATLTYNSGTPTGDQWKVLAEWDGTKGIAKIGTAYSSSYGVRIRQKHYYVDDNIDPEVEDGPQIAANPFTAAPYPTCSAIYKQRMVFCTGRTWRLSQPGFIRNFSISEPLKATDAMEVMINAPTTDEILHLVPFKHLVTLTAGAEFTLSPGSQSGALGPNSREIDAQSYRGSAIIPPIVAGSTLLYVQRDEKTVLDLGYFYANDRYETKDMTIVSRHLFKDRSIVAWAYQQNPHSIVWVVMSDGALLSFTYIKEQEVWAWAQHATDGEFIDVDSIPKGSGEDEVSFVVKRVIDGQDVYYNEDLVERLPNNSVVDAVFLDSSLTYSGTAATIFYGFDHLKGKTISVVADGDIIKNLVVDDNGGVTIPNAASKVHFGLPMPHPTVVFLPIEVDGAHGASKRVAELILRLDRTRGFWSGPSESMMTEAKWRKSELYGQPTQLFTGDKPLVIRPEWGLTTSLVIQQRDPSPITISSVVANVDIGG